MSHIEYTEGAEAAPLVPIGWKPDRPKDEDYHFFYETWMDCVLGDSPYGDAKGFKRRAVSVNGPDGLPSGKIAMVFTHKHSQYGKIPKHPISGLVPGSVAMFREYEQEHLIIGYEVDLAVVETRGNIRGKMLS